MYSVQGTTGSPSLLSPAPPQPTAEPTGQNPQGERALNGACVPPPPTNQIIHYLRRPANSSSSRLHSISIPILLPCGPALHPHISNPTFCGRFDLTRQWLAATLTATATFCRYELSESPSRLHRQTDCALPAALARIGLGFRSHALPFLPTPLVPSPRLPKFSAASMQASSSVRSMDRQCSCE